MAEALERLPGPGARLLPHRHPLAMLWALTQAGKADPDAILRTAAGAGYDLRSLKPRLAARAGASRRVVERPRRSSTW